jgi:hypothetical protein
VLAWAATVSEGRDSTAKPAPRVEPKRAAGAIGASHQRHDWVVAAVIGVPEMHPGTMHARAAPSRRNGRVVIDARVLAGC